MSTHITGTLILAGDYAMQIDDNEPLARVVIVMPLADLNAVEMLPMNQDVTVIRSDELAQLRAELAAAREEIERLRSVMCHQGKRDNISKQILGAPFDEDLPAIDAVKKGQND